MEDEVNRREKRGGLCQKAEDKRSERNSSRSSRHSHEHGHRRCRKRSRDRDYDKHSTRYKKPRVDGERRSSRLSVGECALEAKRNGSGVRSVSGSRLRHCQSRGREAVHTSSAVTNCTRERRSQEEGGGDEMEDTGEPYTATLPSCYYSSAGGEKVKLFSRLILCMGFAQLEFI